MSAPQVDVRRFRGIAAAYWRTVGALTRLPWLWTGLRTLVPFAVLVAAWQAVAALHIYSDVLFPGPGAVWQAAVEVSRSGELLNNVRASLVNLGLGFAVGAGLAIPLGLAMGLVRSLANFFDPVITLFQAIPGLAWIPLAILWLGAGRASVTFIIFTSVFFPVLYSMLAGVRSTEPVMIDAAQTMGARALAIIWHVIIPSSMPHLMTGIRLAFGYGFRSLVAGEMVVATAGLGFMIFDARSYMRTDLVMVGMLVIGLIWLVIDRTALRWLERRTVSRWGTLRD